MGRFLEHLREHAFFYYLAGVPLLGVAAQWLAWRLRLPSILYPQGILFASAEPGIRAIAEHVQAAGFSVLLVDTNYANIAAASMAGIPAECASILSEHVREKLDLAGIGRLLAMTANDEVNSLAVREFSQLFGRANVYQLTPWDEGSGKRTSISEHLRGRLLFNGELNHDALISRFARGTQVKSTRLTEEFTYEDFRSRYGDTAIVLFVIDEAKKLEIITLETPAEPKAGQTVIALVEAIPDTTGGTGEEQA